MTNGEQLVRDTLMRELEDYGGLYLHVDSTKDVTIDGVLDVDALAVAVVAKLRETYGLDL
jgi:hypothetical protein